MAEATIDSVKAPLYGELWERIGLEYLNAPLTPKDSVENQRVSDAWLVFAEFVVPQVAQLREQLTIVEVDDADPYPDTVAQSADIAAGRFLVSRSHCEHPVWTSEQNIAFRIWHDVLGHHTHQLGFDRFGELAVYAASCCLVKETNLRKVLFVELLAQTSAAVIAGEFVEQKVYLSKTFGLLHGDDR